MIIITNNSNKILKIVYLIQILQILIQLKKNKIKKNNKRWNIKKDNKNRNKLEKSKYKKIICLYCTNFSKMYKIQIQKNFTIMNYS